MYCDYFTNHTMFWDFINTLQVMHMCLHLTEVIEFPNLQNYTIQDSVVQMHY